MSRRDWSAMSNPAFAMTALATRHFCTGKPLVTWQRLRLVGAADNRPAMYRRGVKPTHVPPDI